MTKATSKAKTKTRSSAVILVPDSGNAKLGTGIAATYVSQASCPKTCPFIDNGCYAELGDIAFTTKRLNRSRIKSALNLALTEAKLIRQGVFGQWGGPGKLFGKFRPLRLHVVGDTTTNEAAKVISTSAQFWIDRIGNVWTYTHAWKTVARQSWGKVSVLASCESLKQVEQASKLGYACALVIDKHITDKTYKAWGMDDSSISYNIIPCPNQTKGVTCSECKLCWKDQWLKATRSVIAFAAHGTRKKLVSEQLIKIKVK